MTPPGHSEPSADVEPRLRADTVTLAYDGRTVSTDLSVSIPSGRFTVILGPNACGKTTLLRALARLLNPHGGQVVLDGKDIRRYPTKEVARRLGLLPQSSFAPFGISVADLVARGRFPHQRALQQWSQADDVAVTHAMQVTNVTELAERSVDELSGGQRQRVWLAMVLAQETPLLLLDEPTTFLDVRHQLDLMHLLRRLVSEHGLAVALVLHDLNQAAGFADHMLLLAGGGVVARGRPTEVLTADHVRTAFEVDARVVVDDATGIPTCVFPGRDAALAP